MTNRASRGVHDRVDAVLEDAEVLQDVDDADLDRADPAPDQGAPRACRHHRPPPKDAPPDQVREPLCVPACAGAIRQTAARDLHLAVSLVVGEARAAVALARFADHDGAETEGALVFGCLLHLAGHTDAAEFWWKYAAGGENPTAAFCLYLYHRNQGQHRTAQHWRTQARALWACDRPPVPRRPPGSLPLLPSHVRQQLLSQCHQGASPHLPPAMEAAINSLYGRSRLDEDAVTEAYPLPVDAFPADLARAAAR